MNSSDYGLVASDLIAILSELSKNDNIDEVILFGSRAKGSYHTGSDIDLALKGNNIGINDILDLSIELDKLLLPYKIDLVIYKRIKEKALIEHIDRVGVKLYQRSNA
ncbi:MAG: nucleotidyltransferase domain-containing protein [Bacteroidota bacterium]|nr:nucleotidyltransferase domain-containing protein [Bacteroidota bacterium]